MPNLRTIDQDGTDRRSVRAVPVLRVVLVVEGTEDDDRVRFLWFLRSFNEGTPRNPKAANNNFVIERTRP